MSFQDRLQRLLPNGYPRYVRVYDGGDKIADRYTVVFSGRYNNGVKPADREFIHLGMSSEPTAPNGFCQLGFSRDHIDLKDGRWAPAYGESNHLGKRIHWHELPEACQKAALHVYKETWDLYKDEVRKTGSATIAAGAAGGVRIVRRNSRQRSSD